MVSSNGVTTEDVRIAYRLFLGREPESQEVIDWHMQARDIETMRRNFMESAEYQATAAAIPAKPPTNPSPRTVRETIGGMEEFKRVLAWAATIQEERGYSAYVDFLNSVHFVPEQPPPSDPLSPDYLEYMLALYRTVSGRPGYDPEKFEAANIPLQSALEHVWPFSCNDAICTGSYFMGVGHIVKVLGIYGCKTVLEYGVGWGHTSLMMAEAGMDVTAADIEPVFLERFKVLTDNKPHLRVRTFHGRFGALPEAPATFDAFVFFECFHHCLDFAEVVPKLKARLKPGGKILLCGEPMLTTGDPPWSVRLDGPALWAASTHGWMELGFREDFLISFFADHGFFVTKHPCDAAGEVGFIYVFGLG